MNRQLIPVFLIILVDVLGLMLIVPLLPLYAEHMGATPFVATLLMSSYAACQLVASPILGYWSDRIGRKPVLLISQAGTFCGFALLAAANTLPLVFISRVIDGLTAGNMSVAHACVSDVTEPKNRARAFGWIGVAFSIGFVVGPALAGLLAAYGPKLPIYAAMLLSAISILATAILLKPASAQKSQSQASATEQSMLSASALRELLRNRSLTLHVLQFACFSLCFAGFFAGFPLFAERRYVWDGSAFGVREIGLLLACMGAAAIPTQTFILGRVIERWGERRVVIGGLIGVALAFGVLPVSAPLAIPLVAVLLLGISSSLVRPTLVSRITHHVPPSQQGSIMGLVQAVVSISQIVSPMGAGWLIGHGWLVTCAVLAALLTTAGSVVGVFQRDRIPAP